MNSAVLHAPRRGGDGPSAAQVSGTGLWVFIAVASTLFSLFLAAYVMRMDGSRDWSQLGMPWQLWLSTALLAAGSVQLHRASRTADAALARQRLLAGGACAIGFLLAQLWGWQVLQAARVVLAGNPAASFFYVLTALHGLHVIGGLVGWVLALRDPVPWRIALCARYWHFLLAVWAVLFAALGWLTPGVVDFICGRS
jgi:cytochrome c oxidase subunit III